MCANAIFNGRDFRCRSFHFVNFGSVNPALIASQMIQFYTTQFWHPSSLDSTIYLDTHSHTCVTANITYKYRYTVCIRNADDSLLTKVYKRVWRTASQMWATLATPFIHFYQLKNVKLTTKLTKLSTNLIYIFPKYSRKLS